MNFKTLDNEKQLEEIAKAKGNNLIFKHNTTCSISKSVIKTFEQEAGELPEGAIVYVLDLIANHAVSDAVAEKFHITHESPQLLLIKDGECLYNESGYDISAVRAAKAIV